MFYKQGPLRRWICTVWYSKWSGGSYIRSQSWFRTAGGKWNGITCLFCWQSVLKRSSLTQANRRPWLSQAQSTLQSQPLESAWTCLHLQSALQSRSSMAHSSSAHSSRAPPSARSSSALSVFITPHLFQFFLVWFPNVLKPCVSLSPTSGIVCLTPVIYVPCVRFNKSDYWMFSSSPRSLLPALDDN